LSSKLLKANHVVTTNHPIVVGVKEHEPIITNEEISLPQSNALQEQMEQELAQLREQAIKELEQWRKQEEEKFLLELEEQKRLGYEEGYQLGIQDGTQHAQQLYQSQLTKAATVLEQAYQEKAAVIQEAEPFVIELTTEIAKKVLKQELKTNPDSLLQLIKEVLASVYETSSITIGVAPEDFAFVQKQREQLMAIDTGAHVEIKVLPDYSVEQGGCIIRTSSGSIDARIDVQLSEIKKVLLELGQEENHE
jgi:flagellar assembly protein FliH